MNSLIKNRSYNYIILLALLFAHQGMGQPEPEPFFASAEASGVVVRIVRDGPTKNMVRWLGKNARPTQFTREGFPTLPTQTAKEIAEKLCGFPTAEYWKILQKINNLASPLLTEELLGEQAFSYQWPACFYFERGDFSQVIQENFLPSHIYHQETGEVATLSQLTNFFRASGIKDLSAVSVGQVVKYNYRTRPIVVIPYGDPTDFINQLRVEAKSDVTQLRQAGAISNGQLVLSSEFGYGAAIASKTHPAECDGITAQPFDMSRVEKAYFQTRADSRTSTIRVLVADNGFFGATYSNNEYIFRRLFDSRFFNIKPNEVASRVNIGPVLDFAGERLSPLNFENGFADDTLATVDSGHGTHVTGIALGGIARGDSSLFGGDEGYWLRANIAAFSPGLRKIPSVSANHLATTMIGLFPTSIDKVAIVNMSVTFGFGARDILRHMIQTNNTTLFVAAAGNEGKNLNDLDNRIFPASLEAPNLITVAAEDGSGGLTAFSNVGASAVDIAAPGCNIESTLDGLDPSRLSGTSQAAPIVSFAAALLLRVNMKSELVKNRLIISGDLLTSLYSATPNGGVISTPITKNSPVPIRSRSKLNIVKALYKDYDYLRFRKGNQTFEVLGVLGDDRIGPVCEASTMKSGGVAAFKQSKIDGQAWCFWRTELQPRPVDVRGVDRLSFTTYKKVLADGTVVSGNDEYFELSLRDVEEFIVSEQKMILLL